MLDLGGSKLWLSLFCVMQVQAERNEQLDFIKIVSCQTQVVAGMNYKIVFDAATPAQEIQSFEATVYGEPVHQHSSCGACELYRKLTCQSVKQVLLAASTVPPCLTLLD